MSVWSTTRNLKAIHTVFKSCLKYCFTFHFHKRAKRRRKRVWLKGQHGWSGNWKSNKTKLFCCLYFFIWAWSVWNASYEVYFSVWPVLADWLTDWHIRLFPTRAICLFVSIRWPVRLPLSLCFYAYVCPRHFVNVLVCRRLMDPWNTLVLIVSSLFSFFLFYSLYRQNHGERLTKPRVLALLDGTE